MKQFYATEKDKREILEALQRLNERKIEFYPAWSLIIDILNRMPEVETVNHDTDTGCHNL